MIVFGGTLSHTWRWLVTSSDWPPLLTFSHYTGSRFIPNSIVLIPSFCKINQFVSITFSSRDNVVKCFSKIRHLTIFKHFVTIFPSFAILLTPILWFLDLFDPFFFQNRRSYWVHCFIMRWTPLPEIWWSTPHFTSAAVFTSLLRLCIMSAYAIYHECICYFHSPWSHFKITTMNIR